MSRIVESSEEDLARPGEQVSVSAPAPVQDAPAGAIQQEAAVAAPPAVPTVQETPLPPQAAEPRPEDSADSSEEDSSEDSSEDDAEGEAVEGEVELDENGEPVQIDEDYAERLRQIAKETPEVRFRHSKFYTKEEDRIIAASLAALIPIYKIAETIHCTRQALARHIENTPVLAQLNADRLGRRCDMVEEGLDELTRLRHPAVLMWRAEKLLSNIYGKERQMEEEDDSVLVIGEIPEAGIAEGDAILAAAAEKPPEVGLSALLDDRVEPIAQMQQTAQQALPAPSPSPAPAVPPAAVQPQPAQQAQVMPQPAQPPPPPPPPAAPTPAPTRTISTPPVIMGNEYGGESFGGGGFDDDFGGNGWLS